LDPENRAWKGHQQIVFDAFAQSVDDLASHGTSATKVATLKVTVVDRGHDAGYCVS
jgi:hypothetical protein